MASFSPSDGGGGTVCWLALLVSSMSYREKYHLLITVSQGSIEDLTHSKSSVGVCGMNEGGMNVGEQRNSS